MLDKPQYVLIQDIPEIFSKISGKNSASFSQSFNKACTVYLKELIGILRDIFGDEVTISSYSLSEVNKKLQKEVLSTLDNSSETVCICLDNFLLSELENYSKYKNRFFRFQITRSFNEVKIPRQGQPSFKNQIQNLKSCIPELNKKQLIIVDDGIFSGKTISEFLGLLRDEQVQASVKKVIGFISSTNRVLDFSFDQFVIIKPISNLLDWVNVRDFTPFGGTLVTNPRTSVIESSIPYIFPWSDGSKASIGSSEGYLQVSLKIIDKSRELVIAIEKEMGRTLIFKELIDRGFCLPNNVQRSIRVSINDSVKSYLSQCSIIIKSTILFEPKALHSRQNFP